MSTAPGSGRVAIITGASSGIGRATAVAMANDGFRLVLTARREEALRRVATETGRSAGDVAIVPADVTDGPTAESLTRTALDLYGRIDCVVCNAGQYIRGAAVTRGMGDFERAMAVNFYGALALIYAVLPHFLRQKQGHIVVVSSVDGKKGLPLDAPYVSPKFALTGFMDVLRQELEGSGVRALTVLPARVDTPMIETLRVPLVSRKISAERVAALIVRGVRRRWSTEVIVPRFGPLTLVVLSAVAPRLGDRLIRWFRLEGSEEKRKP